MIPTFSPQGDGNDVLLSKTQSNYVHSVDPYLFPARGRKPAESPTELLLALVDPYLFPARGRKHFYLDPVDEAEVLVDPYLFPARGRKLFSKFQ